MLSAEALKLGHEEKPQNIKDQRTGNTAFYYN